MNRFEKVLKEYRRLVVLVEEEQSYLAHLKEQLGAVEEELKSMVLPTATSLEANVPEQDALEAANDEHGCSGISEHPGQPASALKEAVSAVIALGDGVTAKQLANHLNISSDAARLRLQRATREGLLDRMATGRYRPIKRSPLNAKTSNTRGPDEVASVESTTAQAISPEIHPELSNGFVAKVG
jgi:hypothetical protein